MSKCVEKTERNRSFWQVWLIVFVAPLLQAFAWRTAQSEDEAVYLEIAEKLAVGDWSAALNGYWSPLYPFLISLGLRVSPYAEEFQLIQWVNAGIFMLSGVAFWVLIRELRAPGEWTFHFAAVATFVFSATRAWSNAIGSPDVLVCGMIFSIAAVLIRIRENPDRRLPYALLGAFIGLGYLAKAALFPLGCLAVLLAVASNLNRRGVVLRRLPIALAIAAVVAGPVVKGISERYGHLSFGESGSLNFAWSVAGAPMFVDWIGDEEYGEPLRPHRILATAPRTFAFVGQNTYDPWYEPSWFYQGVRSRVELSRILQVAGGEVLDTVRYPQTVLLLMVLVLAVPKLRNLRDDWPPVVLAAIPVLGYCFIVTEERYVAGAMTLGIVCVLKCVPAGGVRGLILIVLSCAMLFAVVRMNWRAFRSEPGHEQTQRAHSVLKAGVARGSAIGVIGDPTLAKTSQFGSASFVGASHEIWAWINRHKIVSEVPPEQALEFDRLAAGEQAAVLAVMRSAGSSAVIAVNHPGVGEVAGWNRIVDGMLTIFIPVR